MKDAAGPYVALALCVSACAAAGNDQARVLSPGARSLTAGLDLSITGAKISPGRPAPLPGLQLTGEYRQGLVAGWDAGLRASWAGVRGLFGSGVAADVKWGFSQAAGERGWDFAVRAGGGYHQLNLGGYPIHAPFAEAALLAGFNFNARHHLYGGLRYLHQFAIGDGANTQDIRFVGLSLGHVFRFGQRWAFRPQMALLNAPVSFNGTRADADRRGLSLFQVTFAFTRDM